MALLHDPGDGVGAAPDTSVEVVLAEGGDRWLLVWRAGEQPHGGAATVDPRLVGPGGPAVEVSWEKVEAGVAAV